MFNEFPYEIQCYLVDRAGQYNADSVFEYIKYVDIEDWVYEALEKDYDDSFSIEEARGVIDALISAFELAHGINIGYWDRCDLIDYFA